MSNDPRQPSGSAWLVGGGAMGELVRSKDWSKTPLGAIDSWPESLRTTVNLALASNFPISIAWGPGRVQIYNDGYWPICGGKHPESMGQDFKECWFSAWPAIGEMFENATVGETGFLENQRMFIDRHGYLEETFFTFSFSPIRDETGRVVGLFHPVTEVTAQSLAERRLGVLRKFSDETTNARSLEEASESIIRTLALQQLDVPFALLYLLSEDGGCARLAGSTHVDLASPAAPREVALDGDSTSGWPIAEVVRTCTARVVESLEARFGLLDCGPYPESPRSAMVLPISVAGLAHPLGVLVAGVNPRRALGSVHLTFYSMLQEAVATSLVNARSYEEERKRAEALAEIDRAKIAFFSNVSHEFRTPLTLMLGPLEDALSSSSELPPSLCNQLELAHRNSLRLLKLVNSLLDFARIEANRTQVNYEATDLAALTADLASNFRSACERAGLELRVECSALPEAVYVDRDMWEKIVLNLLSNAFKFTLAGSIGVSLRLTGDGVRLEVRDSGVGIPRHELPHMFERFYRVEGARGRTHEGTGIGLALVQELVRLHGGRIEVESELERGTTFSVSLQRGSAHLPQDRIGKAHALTPTTTDARAYVEEALRWLPDGVADDGAARAAPFEASANALDGSGPHAAALEPAARILLVDDNADMRDYVRRLLATRFDVETAPDGVAALELVRRMPPDLVLSDVMMPRCDGFELLRALRADERTRTVPVILLSARAGEEARVAGLDADADDYLVKPFSARELFARVETHVRLARIRRASERRFRSMADAAPAILWMTDTDDRCTFLSRGWYEYTDQAEPEAMGFGWANALHPDDREDAARTFRHFSARREPFASDYRVRHHSGEYRWVICAGRPRFDEDGRWLGYVGSVIDITERKRAEEALKDADRRKDEFLATLAHELRNPLAPIRTGLELLRRSQSPEGRERSLAIMERQSVQLTRLIDDLLDVSRITQGKLQVRKSQIDLREVVNSAIEAAQPAIDAARHTLTVELPEEPVLVDADLARLSQVFSNLLSNAARYTPAGGQIRMTARLKGEEVHVAVADNGIGIPPEQLQRVFDMFTQVDRPASRGYTGLGIGLALVKSLVQMHGGAVSAYSAGPNLGSEFVVRLPCELAAARGSSARAAVDPLRPGAARRVLVVDDNEDAAELLSLAVAGLGNEVRTAHDGLEALELASAFRPDAILMDMGMPRMDGYEAARRIRREPWGVGITLVAVTGWGQEEDRRKTREAGFNHHLVKPADVHDVEAILRMPAA